MPCSLEMISVTATSVTLQWMPPKTPNGVITQYSIQFGDSVIYDFGKSVSHQLMGTVEGLSPDTEYVLQLRAHTGVGAGSHANLTVKTSGKLLNIIVHSYIKLYKLLSSF